MALAKAKKGGQTDRQTDRKWISGYKVSQAFGFLRWLEEERGGGEGEGEGEEREEKKEKKRQRLLTEFPFYGFLEREKGKENSGDEGVVRESEERTSCYIPFTSTPTFK